MVADEAICARVVAASQTPAGPEGGVAEQPSSSQTFRIASLTPHFILQEVFSLHPERPHWGISVPSHKVLFLLMDHSEKVGQVLFTLVCGVFEFLCRLPIHRRQNRLKSLSWFHYTVPPLKDVGTNMKSLKTMWGRGGFTQSLVG